MKKLFAMIAGLMACSAVYALPVYNPDEPALLKRGVFTCGGGNFGFEVGFRGDYVFNRRVKHKNHGDNLAEAHRNVCDYSINTNALQLTWDICNVVDLYGWVGGAEAEIEEQVRFAGTLASTNWFNIHGRTNESTGWGLGARAVLWQCGRTAIGIDAQYAYSRPSFSCLSLNGVPVQESIANGGFGIDPDKFFLRNGEYQFSVGVSHRICKFVPYVAVKYSNFDGKFKGPEIINSALPGNYQTTHEMKNRNFIGLAIGVTLVDVCKMNVTAEGRFFDENALTIAADFRF
jgi:hypothetical protein